MKSFFNFLLLAGMLLAVTACAAASKLINPTPAPAGPNVRGVFQGITPCSSLTRPLPQVPADSDCEQMIWSITLYQDIDAGLPTTYTLNSAFGIPQQGTMGLAGGGTAISIEGSWETRTGAKGDPQAEVYQLNLDDSQQAVSFLKLSDDILHVLNKDRTLMVGNGAWSYTLNRTDNQLPAQGNGQRSAATEPPPRPMPPPTPAGASVLGVFDGRTPCDEIVFEFTDTASYSGCVKVKWRLTLFQDQATGAPSTYLYMGTSTYREGAWTIVRGMPGDPDAIVYQLQIDGSHPPVSFLKADENHLFLLDRELNFLEGNALFSYTLSRTGS